MPITGIGFDTLGDFHAHLRSELNIGTDLDAVLAEEVRRAAKSLERKYNWNHMRVRGSVPVDAVTNNPWTFQNPGTELFKRFEYLWIEGSDGKREFLSQAEFGDLSKRDDEDARSFVFVVSDQLHFNWTVTKAFTLDYTAFRYTNWPTDDSDPAPATLVHLEEVLYHLASMLMTPFVKDPELFTLHQPLYADALQDARDAEAEMVIGASLLQMDAS